MLLWLHSFCDLVREEILKTVSNLLIPPPIGIMARDESLPQEIARWLIVVLRSKGRIKMFAYEFVTNEESVRPNDTAADQGVTFSIRHVGDRSKGRPGVITTRLYGPARPSGRKIHSAWALIAAHFSHQPLPRKHKTLLSSSIRCQTPRYLA